MAAPTKIGNLEVHDLAGIVPMMDDTELLSLQESIKEGGQELPILLYKGRIVDGRCRATACFNLGIDVEFEDLPNNMTIKEVAAKVVRLNIRRNKTSTQRAIIAFRQWKQNKKLARSVLYTTWGITNRLFQAAEELDALNPDWLEALFNKERIKVGKEYKDTYGKLKRKSTTSIPVVRDWAVQLKYDASVNAIDDTDEIAPTTFQEKVNKLHPARKERYYENLRNLHMEPAPKSEESGKKMVSINPEAIEELAYRECWHSVDITVAQP